MKTIQHDRIYRTADEIEFIRDLGRGIHSPLQGSRIKFLLLCRESIERRDNWENLDQVAITEFLNKAIKEEARV